MCFLLLTDSLSKVPLSAGAPGNLSGTSSSLTAFTGAFIAETQRKRVFQWYSTAESPWAHGMVWDHSSGCFIPSFPWSVILIVRCNENSILVSSGLLPAKRVGFCIIWHKHRDNFHRSLKMKQINWILSTRCHLQWVLAGAWLYEFTSGLPRRFYSGFTPACRDKGTCITQGRKKHSQRQKKKTH